MATHAQITQNNIFSISLQCLKKEVNEEVDFLHADKDKSYIQIDTMVSDGMVKHSQSSQNSKSAMSLQYLKKKFFLFFLTAIWLPLNQLRTII